MTSPGNDTTSPRPVPEAALAPAPPAVSDEDRNRYGALLDNAAGRGLLSPTEYQSRLGQVAEATSVAELQRLVTELPVFDGVVPADAVPSPQQAGTGRTGTTAAPDLDAILWAGRTQAVNRPKRNHQWLVLALVVAVLLVALVTLGLLAGHLAHTHHAGSATAGVGGLSYLRL